MFSDTWRIGDKGHTDTHNKVAARLNASPVTVNPGENIQAAIDANAGRVVYLAPGRHILSGGLVMRTKTHLCLSPGAELCPNADFTAVTMAKCSTLSGGTIDVSGIPGYSSAAVLVDGAQKYFFVNNERAVISGVLIKSVNLYGTGIHFHVSNPVAGGYIAGCLVENVVIQHFNSGLRLEAVPADDLSFINGNIFNNVILQNNRYQVELRGGGYCSGGKGGELCANHFTNIIAECGPTTERALFCQGYLNYFTPFMIWDFNRADWQYAIEYNGMRAGLNYLLWNLDQRESLIKDDSVNCPNILAGAGLPG